MQFLSPTMLLGLGALAAPILIHLWQRRRVVQISFSTLKYLRRVAARTSRNARLENLLLLFLRCLIFALLVLAAARPVVSKKALGLLGGNVARTVILVLDDSMSMSYRAGDRTRLETARQEAAAVLDGLKPGDEVAVLAVNDRVESPVAEPTLDHAVARRAVESIRSTEGATNFAPALIAARKIAAASAKPIREIYLFTDSQATGWQFDRATVFNAAWKDVQFTVVRPDDATAINAAVTGVKLTSALVTEGSRVTGTATVRNFSAAALHDVLRIEVGGSEAGTVQVEVGPAAAADFPFEFQAPSAVAGRTARGVAKLQGDNLPPDDRFYFAIPIYRAPRVIVFEGQASGPERLHSAYFLRRALAAGTGAEPPVLGAGALDDAPINDYSAVFLADVGRLSDRALVKLDNYAKAGGTVVLLPGDHTDLPALAHAELLPATPLRMRELPEGRLASQIVDAANPLFANTWSTGTPFPPLPQRKLIEWKLKAGAQVLVTVAGTEAFVIARDDGAGKVLIVNASPDRAWGDFPLSPAFLPLLQQIALQSSEHGRTDRGFTVGQAVPASPVLPRTETLTVTAPDGGTQAVLLGDKPDLLERVAQSGFYQVGTASDPSLLTFEVNTDPTESDLQPITEEALGRLAPHETVVGLDGLRIWLARARGVVPLWPYAILALALAFAAESVLSNLAARSRSQGDEQHIKTGRLNKRRLGNPFRGAAVEAGA